MKNNANHMIEGTFPYIILYYISAEVVKTPSEKAKG